MYSKYIFESRVLNFHFLSCIAKAFLWASFKSEPWRFIIFYLRLNKLHLSRELKVLHFPVYTCLFYQTLYVEMMTDLLFHIVDMKQVKLKCIICELPKNKISFSGINNTYLNILFLNCTRYQYSDICLWISTSWMKYECFDINKMCFLVSNFGLPFFFSYHVHFHFFYNPFCIPVWCSFHYLMAFFWLWCKKN